MGANYGIGDPGDPEALANGGVIAILKRLRTLFGGAGQVLADVTDRAGRLLGIATLAAGEAHIGEVAISGNVIAVTPTITAGAYSAKDAVGGLLTFAAAARKAAGMGVIESLVVIDNDSENAELLLVLFDRTFTAMVDNAAFDPSDADLANCVGWICIGAGKHYTFADNSVATVIDQPLQFKLAAAGTSLFGQLMCIGTPTYTAVSDLTIKLSIRYLD